MINHPEVLDNSFAYIKQLVLGHKKNVFLQKNAKRRQWSLSI